MNSVAKKMILSTGVLLILSILIQHCYSTAAALAYEYSGHGYNNVRNGQQSTLLSPSSSSSSSYSSPFRRSQDNIHRFKSLDRVLNRLERGGGGINSAHGSTNVNSNSNNVLQGNSLKFDDDAKNTTNNGGAQYKNSFGSSFDSRRLYSIDDDDEDLDGDDGDDDSYEEVTEVLSDKTSTPHWSYAHNNKHNGYRAAIPVTTTSTSTTTTTTTTPPPPPPMSFSQLKWQNLGNRQAVEHYRRQTLLGQASSNNNNNNPTFSRHSHHHHHNNNNNNSHHSQYKNYGSSSTNGQSSTRTSTSVPIAPDTSIREAINHALKVTREGSCKTPRPRLVRVNDFYPHPGKTYVPHCTILHQCSDDTGCCRHDVLTCSPKTTQRVELSFYTITMDSNRGSTVERLVFYNHTECECRDRMEDLMPRDVSVPAVSSSSSGGRGRGIRFSQNQMNDVTSTSGGSRLSYNTFDNSNSFSTGVGGGSSSLAARNNEGEVNRVDSNSLLGCKCPSAYTERILPDSSCTCDCFDKEKECLKLKKGRIFFTMQDKWCIQTGRCEIPSCAYGSYIHLIGRCPRKKERYGSSMSWHRYMTQ